MTQTGATAAPVELYFGLLPSYTLFYLLFLKKSIEKPFMRVYIECEECYLAGFMTYPDDQISTKYLIISPKRQLSRGLTRGLGVYVAEEQLSLI